MRESEREMRGRAYGRVARDAREAIAATPNPTTLPR